MSAPVRTVTCPQCGEPAEWSSANPSRPFCSPRCKLIDLGCWANESYKVPVVEQDEGLDAGSDPA